MQSRREWAVYLVWKMDRDPRSTTARRLVEVLLWASYQHEIAATHRDAVLLAAVCIARNLSASICVAERRGIGMDNSQAILQRLARAVGDIAPKPCFPETEAPVEH